MTEQGTTGVTLDLVLLGSRLAFGPLELAVSGAVAMLWLLFGAWLWRACRQAGGGAPVLFYGLATIGLFVGVPAQEALLFYAGLAVAGYATVAALFRIHGPGHARTAAAQVMLLVLGDLILFELLVYLYTEAQTAGFGELRDAYRVKGGGLSFVGVLLVATGGCRVAGLFLLMPLSGRLHAWRPGAAAGLVCVALVAGLLPGARLVDPTLATAGVWYTLLAMLGAAFALYLLAVTCVLAQARIDGASRQLSAMASRAASFGADRLARMGGLSARLVPRLLEAERRLLSWPVAVATATAFAALLALSFASGGVGSA
ncbi:MAG: hypothetical protein RIC38_06790 [Chromatocurvus sp.]